MREPRGLHRFLCTLATTLAVVLVTPGPPAEASSPPTMPVAEVERGQQGYGLSVFAGGVPERFDVEVIGVWENVQPQTSYVLARLSGQGLEHSGVIAGMSGSPVFVDGRLLGAVAFAWQFSKDAIAGITPIEDMNRLQTIKAPTSVAGGGAPELVSVALQTAEPGALVEALGELRPVRIGEGTAAVQWNAAGFRDASRSMLEQGLGALAAAGQSTAPGAELEPGAAVAAVLIDGDLRLASSGTVTARSDETILAFGHPFMGLGATAIPMASADVVTVIPSLANSFKVTNVGEIVGAFDFDHAVGIRGRIGAEAPMIPVSITLRGPAEQAFDVEVAYLERTSPVLVAVALLGALEAATGAVGAESLDVVAELSLSGGRSLRIDQSFDGQSAGIDAALHLFSVIGYLMNNPLEEVGIERVAIDATRHPEPRVLRLVGAHAARSVVRPGDTVVLNLELAVHRGGTVRKSIEVPLPMNLPAGRYSLLVGDGVSIDAARVAIEPVEPVAFHQALEFLDSLNSRRELVVLGVFPEPGLSVAGETLPRLPSSVRSLWGAAPSGSARPLRLAIAQQQKLRLEGPVDGAVRVDIEIERHLPWSPDKARETNEGRAVASDQAAPAGREERGDSTSPPAQGGGRDGD